MGIDDQASKKVIDINKMISRSINGSGEPHMAQGQECMYEAIFIGLKYQKFSMYFGYFESLQCSPKE